MLSYVAAVVVVLSLLLMTGCEDGDRMRPRGAWRRVPNDRIVFMSRADDPAGELYLLDKDGLVTRLTRNGRHENNPALSPDGTRVAFHAGPESDLLGWEIYVLELASGRETRLTHNRVLDGHPDWSPDGGRIVFASFRDGGGNPTAGADIFVMGADGSGLRRLTSNAWEDNDPEWSPDGSRIAFKSTRHTRQAAREEIYVMNADGSGATRLSATEGWQSDHDPSWSPDGQTIAFMRFEGSRPWFDITKPDVLAAHWRELIPWNVFKTDLGGNVTRLTDGSEMYGLPVFSADGSKILYLHGDLVRSFGRLIGVQHRLRLIDPDGRRGTPLTEDSRHTGTLEYFDW